MGALEEPHRKLLEEPNFAFVGTIRKDGSPHVVPTWVDFDGDKVVLNSSEGRAWPANLRRDNRVNLTIPIGRTPTSTSRSAAGSSRTHMRAPRSTPTRWPRSTSA